MFIMQDQVFSLSATLEEASICCLWILDIIHFSFTCAFVGFLGGQEI